MTAGGTLPEDAVFRREELLHDIAMASPQPFSSSKRGEITVSEQPRPRLTPSHVVLVTTYVALPHPPAS